MNWNRKDHELKLKSQPVPLEMHKVRTVQKLTLLPLEERICSCFDMIYFSARKLTCARGGGMCFRNEKEYLAIRDLLPLYEGFATYGGISVREGVPAVTPAGELGVHLDCKKFVPHVPQDQYPAAAVHAALYLVSGIRGTLSESRDEEGNEVLAKMELLRLALPRRVFTLSQIIYAVDRITWLYENRELIGGLKFTDEPKELRFFFGELEPIGDSL